MVALKFVTVQIIGKMARAKQYPHHLILIKPGGDSVQDENGDWSESTPINEFKSMCREEPNGSGEELNVGGGKYYKYSSLVQMPKGVKGIKEGDSILIANDRNGQDVRVQGIVLKFDSRELHCRMWID